MGGRAGILSQLVDKAEGMLIKTPIFSDYLGFRYELSSTFILYSFIIQALLKRTMSLNCYRILYNNVIKFDSTITICNPGNSTRERRDANPRPGGVDGMVAQTSGPRSQLVVSHLDPHLQRAPSPWRGSTITSREK